MGLLTADQRPAMLYDGLPIPMQIWRSEQDQCVFLLAVRLGASSIAFNTSAIEGSTTLIPFIRRVSFALMSD